MPQVVELDNGCSLSAALAHVAALLPDGQDLPPQSLVAVAGEHLGTVRRHAETALCDGQELTLIVPVAGG